MVNSHTDCHAAVRNHMPGNLVFSSLGFSPALQSPASAMVSLSPDGHSHHAPHNLVPFPTQSWWGGRAERGCSCPSVPVPHQPASSEHARVTQWQVSVTAPCPGYLFWPSHGWDTTAWRHGMGQHQDSHWWRTLASHQRKVELMCESGLEGEGWDHRRSARDVALTLSLRCQHVLFPRGGSWPCHWAGLETAPSEHFLLLPLSPKESGPPHLSLGK